MWWQHQNLNRQLPHLARVPRVLSPLSEMHMGDIRAWSSPADPHQLQSTFRSGGPGVQVSPLLLWSRGETDVLFGSQKSLFIQTCCVPESWV